MTPAEQNLVELRALLARCKARAHGAKEPEPPPNPLPKPTSAAPPPRPWQDREPGGDDT